MIPKSNWSRFGMLAGLFFAGTSYFKYAVMISDIDRLIAYVAIGVLITAVAFLYGRVLDMGTTIVAMEDFLSEK